MKNLFQLLVLFAIIIYSAMFMFLAWGIGTPIVNRLLPPSAAFRKFVCDPIPKSVTEIKIDRLIRRHEWHRYIFHFKIDEAGLSLILNSRPFQEIKYFKYDPENGGLEWAREEPPDYSQSSNSPTWISSDMQLYNIRSGESEPEWFNLEQWDSPKVYLDTVRDVNQLWFLVYNKELGEAYFIDYRSPD